MITLWFLYELMVEGGNLAESKGGPSKSCSDVITWVTDPGSSVIRTLIQIPDGTQLKEIRKSTSDLEILRNFQP